MLGIMAAAHERLVPPLTPLIPDVVADDAAPPKRIVPAFLADAVNVVIDDDASIFASPDSALQLLAYCPWKVPLNFN